MLVLVLLLLLLLLQQCNLFLCAQGHPEVCGDLAAMRAVFVQQSVDLNSTACASTGGGPIGSHLALVRTASSSCTLNTEH